MSNRFYTNSTLVTGPVLLQGPEAHHLAIVCRFRAGDHLVLFNGDGREYAAEVTNVSRKHAELNVLSVSAPSRELGFQLEIASPLPKGERGDFLIEKLTELGVTDFVPLLTARAIVQPRDTKLDRLRRAVIEASKQCGRNVLMQIHELADWETYCGNNSSGSKWLAHPVGQSAPTREPLGDARCAIGPEGGFTDDEMDLAVRHGWTVVGLGPRVLRMETAAIALALLAGPGR